MQRYTIERHNGTGFQRVADITVIVLDTDAYDYAHCVAFVAIAGTRTADAPELITFAHFSRDSGDGSDLADTLCSYIGTEQRDYIGRFCFDLIHCEHDHDASRPPSRLLLNYPFRYR